MLSQETITLVVAIIIVDLFNILQTVDTPMVEDQEEEVLPEEYTEANIDKLAELDMMDIFVDEHALPEKIKKEWNTGLGARHPHEPCKELTHKYLKVSIL